ncbi:uncharacterized protein LOC124925796 [Impatiens glandulifera]|uniref:uncharacterized protein LOC124925796 n=1 Tax=Impatiens glandulifera TaxID=253017 RepID=UPI001FB09A1A|nr:uncharacterized protein LOC124925796 [Impatiens glandulifera]XP_047321855.1 uncharacterized protein LOC124925796 [Impatiens glandulifera]
MGNCLEKPKVSMAEITPSSDSYLDKSSSIIKSSLPTPIVKLYGSLEDTLTNYIRFALQYKPVNLQFVLTQPTRFGSEMPYIRFESDTVWGSLETILEYVESKFPDPPLARKPGWIHETPPPAIVTMGVMQHRSMTWHLDRMVRWAEDLAARGGKARGDPRMGSPRMEVRKFATSYSQLLELMLEHAQMEETVVFPVLERADRGLSKVANEEHAMHLPIMNGIKEDIKSIGVMDSGSPVFVEALVNLPSRLKKLQTICNAHFEEEERELFPLMEATELSRQQQERAVEESLKTMRGTHSNLFTFFMEGLSPRDAMHYLQLVHQIADKGWVATMFRSLVEPNER